MSCDCGKPKCDGHCGASPAVLQINNPGGCILFHKVEVPASMGDSVTNPPRPGAYKNVLLYYKADGEAYLYSSDGMPTKVTGVVSDYACLENKPQINGVTLEGDKSLEDLGITGAIDDALEDYTPTSGLAEVAFTGDYEDLENTPTPPVTHFYRPLGAGVDMPTPLFHNPDFSGQVTYQQFEDAVLNGPVQIFVESGSTTTYAVGTVDIANIVVGSRMTFYTTRNTFREVFRWESSDDAPTYVGEDPYSIQSNWSETDSSSPDYIRNKPTIPTVNNATLTITQNGTSAGTFTANASSDTTINLTDTTYSAFSGATPSTAGASGLVPAPAAGDGGKALKGDGTWGVVGNVVELFIEADPDSLPSPFEIYKDSGKTTPITWTELRSLFTPSNQKTVVLHSTTAGDGVYPVVTYYYNTTEFNIFDAYSNATYYIHGASGGSSTGFTIEQTDLQERLTAGTGISIADGVISATNSVSVVQATGQSTTAVMSQKAVTDAIGGNNVVNLMDYVDPQTYIFDLDRLMPKLQELDNIYTILYGDTVLVFYGVGDAGGNLVFHGFPMVVKTGDRVDLQWVTLSIDMATGALVGVTPQSVTLYATSSNELKLNHSLTINVGGNTYEYDGSQDVNITIP